jgi:UDP-glucose 4-epimerase
MRETMMDPLEAFRQVNVAGTLNLARQAAEAGVRRFVYVSSIKVNGERSRPGVAFTAEDTPHPEDPYGLSKREAEVGLRALSHETGLEVVIIRPPLVYGPGVNANFLRLMRLVERGIPQPLGAVYNHRSLVSVDNLVDLLVHCLDDPRAAGETFLVSDGEDLSTPRLIREIASAMGRPARLLPVPVSVLRLAGRLSGRSGVVERLCGSLRVDIGKTCERLDWTPPLSVQEGIRRTVEHYLAGQRAV